MGIEEKIRGELDRLVPEEPPMDIWRFREKYGTRSLGLMIQRVVQEIDEAFVYRDSPSKGCYELAVELGRAVGDLEHALANLPKKP